MMAVAPNVTVLLGDLVGARMLAQGGIFIIFVFLKQPCKIINIYLF